MLVGAAVIVLVMASALVLGQNRSSRAAVNQASASSLPSGGQGLPSGPGPLPTSRALGQLIVAPLQVGTPASPQLLAAIREGRIGSVILFGSSLSPAAVRGVVDQLQSAARAGGNPGLLIMTDQEGSGVERLAGPPTLSASQMGNPHVAEGQGLAAGRLLRSAGVNVDLAPVADVSRAAGGFITVQQRSFGANPSVVARAACAFATGLRHAGVAYTLKHFPGLGDAIQSTDTGAVRITESARQIYADDAAYRRCGQDPHALVMISNASYSNLTGSTPAVLSRAIYRSVMPNDGISAVSISDSLDAGAMVGEAHPALRAVRAGMDLLLYTGSESEVAGAYTVLSSDVRHGELSANRIDRAAAAVLALKQALGLNT
jgi:beta-N-acetylhexosaminidase